MYSSGGREIAFCRFLCNRYHGLGQGYLRLGNFELEDGTLYFPR